MLSKKKKKISRIILRKVNFSDIEFLWYLRNQKDVYKYSISNKIIKWEEHINWIIPIILKLKYTFLFVIVKEGMPVGQIRFDLKDKNATISITIMKEFRENGFAKEAIKKGINIIKKEKNINNILAKIHKDNISSLNLFKNLNFKEKNNQNNNWIEYEHKIN